VKSVHVQINVKGGQGLDRVCHLKPEITTARPKDVDPMSLTW
jgi:hypothetical protein